MKNPLTRSTARLAMSALAPAMLALAAGALLFFSRHTLETAQGQRDSARTALARAAAEVSMAEDLVRRHELVQAHLATLHERGLDQAMDELRWHETLTRARRDLHVSSLRYTLPPESPEERAADAPPSSLRISSLRFEAELRHEGDFLALMHRLEQVGAGVRTRHCRLALTQEEDSAPRLKARCELERAYVQAGEGGIQQADQRRGALPSNRGAPLRQDQER